MSVDFGFSVGAAYEKIGSSRIKILAGPTYGGSFLFIAAKGDKCGLIGTYRFYARLFYGFVNGFVRYLYAGRSVDLRVLRE